MSKDNNSKWNFVEMPANVPSRSGEDSTLIIPFKAISLHRARIHTEFNGCAS